MTIKILKKIADKFGNNNARMLFHYWHLGLVAIDFGTSIFCQVAVLLAFWYYHLFVNLFIPIFHVYSITWSSYQELRILSVPLVFLEQHEFTIPKSLNLFVAYWNVATLCHFHSSSPLSLLNYIYVEFQIIYVKLKLEKNIRRIFWGCLLLPNWEKSGLVM